MEKSNFVKTFGSSPRILVLDFLLDNDSLDYCKSDIAEQTGISRATLDTFWSELIKRKLIVKSRTIGRAQLYRLNKNLLLVKKLIELDNSINVTNEKELLVKNCSRN